MQWGTITGACRYTVRYRKPCLTNLPADLGQEIFAKILSLPPQDRKQMREEANRLLTSMLAAREHENTFTLR